MSRPSPLLLLLAGLLSPLLLGGCGSDMREVMAGSYVLGNPHTARFKSRYFQARSRGSFMVNDTYVTSDLIEPILESTDAVLLLMSTGRFAYDGPPRSGQNPAGLSGTWSFEDGALKLHVEAAAPAHPLTGTTITCAYRPGIISYPADPNAGTSDAGTPVYFDLALDRELPKVPTGIGGIRVGDRR